MASSMSLEEALVDGVQRMKQEPSNAKVQVEIFKKLRSMTAYFFTEEERVKAHSCNYIQEIVAALRNHPQDKEVQSVGSETLRVLLRGSPERRATAAAAGAVQALVAGLDGPEPFFASDALGWLCMGSDPAALQLQQDALARGAWEKLLKVREIMPGMRQVTITLSALCGELGSSRHQQVVEFQVPQKVEKWLIDPALTSYRTDLQKTNPSALAELVKLVEMLKGHQATTRSPGGYQAPPAPATEAAAQADLSERLAR